MITERFSALWHKIKGRSSSDQSADHLGKLKFRCNICGAICRSYLASISREISDCQQCGSTLRMRALIALLSEALFNRSLAIPEFPVHPEICGIGMSDWEGYAIPLAQKLSYTNTYYHQEPFMDIMNITADRENSYDFIISTDVFEHVLPPIQQAFDNTHRLLKPNGVFIFSVPFSLDESTVEHFPDINNFQIIKNVDQYVLENTTSNGELQIFKDLIFHGGPGSTLEMRVFSKKSLLAHLYQAGFKDVRFRQDSCHEFGINWSHNWSIPIIARA